MLRRVAEGTAIGTLALAAACAASCRAGGPAARESPRPRAVILISIDTLRADRLNAYGYEARRTSPRIDALAGDGILFENHVASSPWTTPSHMSLFTSLSPSAHGVTRPFGLMAQQRTGSAEAFERLSDEHPMLTELLAKDGFRTAAFTGGVTMHPRIGFDRGFERYDSFMGKVSTERMSKVLEWIEQNRAASFFLFLHTFEVHAPYLEGDFLDDVLKEPTARSVGADLQTLARADTGVLEARSARKVLNRRGVFTRDVASALYDGGVLSADRWVGSLVDKLEALGLYDDSLIVVTSDHGEQLGEKAGAGGNRARHGGFYDVHGNSLFEELVHIPLIVKLPAKRHAGGRVSAVTRTIDVMPTILDFQGVSAPPSLQGASLRRLWERPGEAPREAVSESLGNRREAKSLRSGRYKYVVSMSLEQVAARGRAAIPEEPDTVELYDLVADPGETTNLLRGRTPAEAADRRTRLDAELRRVVALRVGHARSVPMTEEALERLRALGYVE